MLILKPQGFKSCTVNPTPYTLNPTPLHPYTKNPKPKTQNPESGP